MKISITSKDFKLNEHFRTDITKIFEDVVTKYFESPIEGGIVFSKDGYSIHVNLEVHVGQGILIVSEGKAKENRLAFDKACEHLGKRLRRQKGRMRDHHTVQRHSHKS